MVIPFAKQGDDKQLIVEDNFNCYRYIETELKRELLDKNLRLIDYRLSLKQVENDLQLHKRSQGDIVSLLVEIADPNFYIIADIERMEKTSRGNGQSEKKLVVNLTAHQTNDASTFAADIFDSGWRYYDECNALTAKLMMDKGRGDTPKIGKFIENLLDVKTDRSINIDFRVDKSSQENFFSTLPDGTILMEAIMNWLEDRSLNKPLESQVSGSLLKFQRVQIVLDDETEPASSGKIGLHFVKYLNGLSDKIQFRVDTPGDNILFILK